MSTTLTRPLHSADILPSTRIPALIARHGQALERFAFALTQGDRLRTEHLLQDTWASVSQHADTIAGFGSDTALRPWLFGVARGIAIGGERADGEACVARKALMTLGDEERRVLFCTYLRGMSARDTAKALGVPLRTVKALAHHATRTLRQLLHATDAY
ncbi:sigma factor-like helix-turn-helix DNA-binding protein [Streptomyces sp. NPDC000410]|uniref:sigma factor-like helix-turn-helix DNA-binding protein n=1 Tax=Streptomyces sp. NPDC000410 TaxID=3154254 RepID=UPI00332593BC